MFSQFQNLRWSLLVALCHLGPQIWAFNLLSIVPGEKTLLTRCLLHPSHPLQPLHGTRCPLFQSHISYVTLFTLAGFMSIPNSCLGMAFLPHVGGERVEKAPGESRFHNAGCEFRPISFNSFFSFVVQVKSQGTLLRESRDWQSHFRVEIVLESVKFEIEHSWCLINHKNVVCFFSSQPMLFVSQEGRRVSLTASGGN